jgi:DNA replication initiation complex subunit (GINS family)
MFNELFKVWKKEEDNVELQSLSQDFYVTINRYLNDLREKIEKEQDAVKIELIKEEYNYAVKILSKLVNVRLKKIMKNVIEGKKVPLELLAEEEREAFSLLNKVVDLIVEFKEKLFKGKIEEEKKKAVVVRLLQELPEIVGEDLKVYGPFENEDVAVLPEENAEALVKRGAAERIAYKD